MLSKQPRGIFYAFIYSLLARNALAADNTTAIPLTATGYGLFYHFDVQIGGQTLPLVADTGSADLWVVGSNWQCYFGQPALNGTPSPREACSLGNQTYTTSSTFTPGDTWLGEHYGQGDVVGSMGYDDIQFGPVSISQQEISVVNATSISATEGTSGIFGLAYPVLEQAHPLNYSASSTEEYYSDRIGYPSVLTRLKSMNITNYSMALERMPLDQESGFGGYLSFGSLPPVDFGNFVTVPVEIDDAVPLLLSNGTKQISYWALTVDAVHWTNMTNTTSFQAVVDSGNQVNFLPEEIAASVSASFDPPGTLVEETYYAVDCAATPPASFGIQIGGFMFSINSTDMIWRDNNGTCFSSVAPAPPFLGTLIPILGDAFLKNVVAVFDYGNNTMSFAPRATNSSTITPSSTSGGTALDLQMKFFAFALTASMIIATLL